MKKSTVAMILYAINILLVIAIVILVIQIAKRGPMPEDNNSNLSASLNEIDEEEPVEEPDEVIDTSVTVLVAVPTSVSSVNVRSGPGTDYQRIGSAYSDYDYEVISIQSNGWTKLIYDGITGYISSEYLMYKTKTTYTASDAATYQDATDEDIAPYLEDVSQGVGQVTEN